MKRFLVTAVLVLVVILLPLNGFACTAVYVGKDVSADGTVILGKSNDYQAVWPNHVAVTERMENAPGRSMPVDNDRTVFAPLPATTYRYTSTPWMDSAVAMNGLGYDATVCTNEYGVAMEMSISALSNKAALAADPLVEHGLSEFTAVDLVVCQSATAREAVSVLVSLLDEYGSSEVNIALIADREEAWYVEMYSGHQYAAVKLPDDRASVFGNEFSLEYLSGYEESVLSSGLKSLPEEKGFAVTGENGELNLLATYSGEETVNDDSHMRTWIGHRLLSSGYESYQKSDVYPLCFAPDQKVSVQDVMEILRNRFEGTPYCPDETGRTDMAVIGTETALSVHIVQVWPELPADMACITWESTGPALYGVFVPVSNAALSISAPYARSQGREASGEFDTNLYPYYRFKELSTLCAEKADVPVYGRPVRAYWHEAETGMTARIAEVLHTAAAMEDREAARRLITDYCNTLQEQAFSDAGKLLNAVRFYKSQNSNTLKNSQDPETYEVLDELKPVDPLEVSLDPEAYFRVPAAE